MISRALRWPLKLLAPAKSLTSDRATHAVFLAISLLMVTVPFFLTHSTDAEARVSLGGRTLPPICIARMCGGSCPGCGLTRSFVYLAHGEMRASFKWHRLGGLLYIYFLYQIVFRGYLLARPAATQESWAVHLQHWAACSVVLLLLLNWLVGFATGSNGSP